MKLQGRHLTLRMRGADVERLQESMRALHHAIPPSETHFGRATHRAVVAIQKQEKLEPTGIVDERTAAAIGRLVEEQRNRSVLAADSNTPSTTTTVEERIVRGNIRHADGRIVTGSVRAIDKDLRREETLGTAAIDPFGRYEIRYPTTRFARAEKRTADLIVRVFGPDGHQLAASDVWFNAPAVADVDVTVPAGTWELPTLFATIRLALRPLHGGVAITALEENRDHQDITFLAGETGLPRAALIRFVLAHRLAQQGIEPEFWFAVLGAPLRLSDSGPISGALAEVLERLPGLDATGVGKALVRSINLNEIAAASDDKIAAWLEAFRQWLAGRLVTAPSRSQVFVKSALEHAGVTDADRQRAFARLFDDHRALSPELLKRLQQEGVLQDQEALDLQTSFALADVSHGDFSTVKALRQAFDVARPDQIRKLARTSEAEWIDAVTRQHAAGVLDLPFAAGSGAERLNIPAAELFGRALHRRFSDAFPTAAFAGGLDRRLQNGGVRGLQHAQALSGLLQRHQDFELLRTPIDRFLDERVDPDLQETANDPAFRLELKAVQRVFKVAPSFEATDTLLGDGIHSAQQIYRLGEDEFVSRYAERDGFDEDSARRAWNVAADTHAAVISILGELIALDESLLPIVLKGRGSVAAAFPNWNNLFKTGDFCECDQCRSVLGPTAYFADLLTFLRDRMTPTGSVKDLLFHRRPDLGYLELSCENASTLLPYIDVVNEVLEEVIAAGADDIELPGLTVMASDPVVAKQEVGAAFTASRISLGADFSLSQVRPGDPDLWVVHGDDVTYLLKKKTTANFFAEVLRNTKTTAAELRAYPQYVKPHAYIALRQARYPFALPFDAFAEEVRASLQKVNIKRWDLMRTLRNWSPPNHAAESEIAAEYFGISIDATAPIDEARLILVEDPTVGGQQEVWGETGNAAWLTAVGNVEHFLRKTGLEYVQLLALLDLTFINPAGDIFIEHPQGASCDTSQKIVRGLDPAKLDRIHRFLRLWRKLNGWQLWELDLVVRHPAVGRRRIDEKFLVQLQAFSEMRSRLGPKTTVEQALAVVGDLNVETRFTGAHEKRADGLYQTLFLNRQLIQPLDPAFEVAAVHVTPPTLQKLPAHRPVLLAALNLPAASLDSVMRLMTPAGASAIGDDLTLHNLSILWRHVWLAKQLKWKIEDWVVLLTVMGADPSAAWRPSQALEFIERVQQLRDTGFTADELLWILAADRSAKAAAKEADCARFLRALWADLQAIRSDNDPAAFEFLADPAAADEAPFAALLTSLLQKLNRVDTDVRAVLATLRGPVRLVATAEGLPANFAFPSGVTGAPSYMPLTHDAASGVLRFDGIMTAAQRGSLLDDTAPAMAALGQSGDIDAAVQLDPAFAFPTGITGAPNNIPIQYDHANTRLRFSGVMTTAQRATLLDDPSLAAVTTDAAYRGAIEEIYGRSLQLLSRYRTAIDELYEQGLTAAVDYVVTEIDAPGSTLTLPPTLPSLPIRYDATKQALSFIGVMTAAEQADLKAIGSNPAAAIDELFERPRLAVKFYEPVFTAALDALPPGLDLKTQLPAPLAAKVSYDEEERLLRFAGIPTPAEQSLLTGIVGRSTSAEIAYQAAVMMIVSQPRAIADGDPRVWMSGASLDGTQAASDTTVKRMRTAARRALDYLSASRGANAVVESGSAYLGLSAAATRYLLTQYARFPGPLLAHMTDAFASTAGPVDYASRKTTFDGWFWAARVASIIRKWNVTLAETKALDRLGPGAQLLDVGTLPLDRTAPMGSVDRFVRMRRLLRLRQTLPETRMTLLDLLTRIATGVYEAAASVQGMPAAFSFPSSITAGPGGVAIAYDQPSATLRATGLMSAEQRKKLLTDPALSAVTGIASYAEAIEQLFESLLDAMAADVERVVESWPAADVAAFTTALDFSYPADFLRAETWERMRQAFSFAASVNAGAETAMMFAAPTMTASNARTLKDLLRARFGAETWLTLCAEIQDVLRERKRDALAAYLLAQPKPADAPTGKWENTNDLYAYYLLDVEMDACQLTSRLVQGSGSVQLFVQRSFMGLEPRVPVQADGDRGDSAWRWWSWMRKYRVWEANRKVFLWPENWIEPELRRDRSTFFRALENELVQNEVDQGNAETAFLNYLERLNGVASLEVVGFYQEDSGDETIVHVFGRTPGAEPHRYYYRRYDYRHWTPWEEVELEIQGDYIIPAVVNRRLFLLWPVFREVPDEPRNSTVTIPANPGSSPARFAPDKTGKRLQMQMAVSEYRQGRWTPKIVSTTFDQSAPYDGEVDLRYFWFVPIDRSDVDGRFFIKYHGYGLDAKAARDASKTLAQAPMSAIKGALYGEVEISGCKGPHDLRFLPADGSFEPARPGVRAEEDSTGLAVAGQWVERFTRYDSYLARTPQDDFTIENQFRTTAPLLTPVLGTTPGLFAMSPAWHCSYMDRLWLTPGDAGEWFGTWLPFFYVDSSRTFFVLPADLQGYASGVGLGDYYPEIKRNLRAQEHLFEAPVQTWVDAFVAALTPEQRSDLEAWLVWNQQVSVQPPYTDAQFKALIAQYPRSAARRYLKGLSDDRVQYEQFHFKAFYHPLVCSFTRTVSDPLGGIPALMRRDTQLQTTPFRFADVYRPTQALIGPAAYPIEEVDFSPDGAYSPYNWELFFHAPLLIANALSRNQRFEEARNWYHFIFNPLGVERAAPGGSPMSKYWITKPFFQTQDSQYVQQRIENILQALAGDRTVPGFAQMIGALEQSVVDWRTNPFDPHRIANYRTVAYQKTVVMKYIENLIAWGDFLFRQDSMESINEATQLYIMAAEILGPRPRNVPPRARPPVESFNELEHRFDAFGNALVEVENVVPQMPGGSGGGKQAPLPLLYFCIPPNEKMLAHWDTVADRLYKIRHCMNIDGVLRQLALFEPPIDPALLVKAAAGGLDVGAALADLNAPLPLYRFDVLLRKASECCADVRALGAALLSVLEKRDAEDLALLRQSHESRLLEAVKSVREAELAEAKESVEGLRKAKTVIETRRDYYRDIERLTAHESLHLDKLGEAHVLSESAQGVTLGASIISYLPAIDLGASGWGGSPISKFKIGGLELGQAAALASDVLSFLADIARNDSAMAAAKAGYERRWDEWKFLERVADKELEEIDSRIAQATLHVTLIEKEIDQLTVQTENAKAVTAFMQSKYTNSELYQWHVGQIAGVYFQSYKLAYDLARRAERCFRFELGLSDSSYVSFGYWDSLRKGLLAGEKLQYDLRRLEAAYLEQNRREFELTKHVSLALLDPLALVKLRETGRCFFRLTEETFDLDFPGHYFRRLKSASLSLPCVVGPYTTIGCTLRLLKNSVRINTANGDNGYPRNVDGQGLPADDTRFVENNIPVKATAASSAQNDSGMFELSFRDERYLPFEGAGAVSEWVLELFSDLPSNNPDPARPDFGAPLRQFDYGTITDVVLHLKYTAREDAGPFKNAAIAHLREYFSEDGSSRSLRLVHVRREFSSEWQRFLHPGTGAQGNFLALEVGPRLFPWKDAGKTLKINTLWVLARCSDPGSYQVTLSPPLPPAPQMPASDPHAITLVRVNQYGGLHFAQHDVTAADVEVSQNDPAVIWQLQMKGPGGTSLRKDPVTGRMEVEDLFLVLGYSWE